VYSIEDLQRTLGLTRRQVRERLAALAGQGDLLDGQVRIGPRGKKFYSVAVLDMLRDLDELARTHGMSLDQAAGELAAKIRGAPEGNESNNGAAPGSAATDELAGNQGQLDVQLKLLQTLVDDLRKERDYWRDMALKLQEQVRDLERLALPAPKDHKPWWARGIFRWLWSG
jgi:hypothetical protein